MDIVAMDMDAVARHWWVILLRGIAGILFGILTFFAPGLSLAALVLLFGVYAFADGVLAIAHATRRGTSDRWWTVLQGVVGVLAGVLTLLWPGITAFALLWVIAAWALVTGALEVAAAIRLRKLIRHEWLLALSGIASIVLGFLLMLYPGAGALAVILWIGAYALVSGTVLVVLAFRLRSWGRSHTTHPQPAHA